MTCEQCGRELAPHQQREYDGGRRARFCSRDCYGAWMVADRGDLATRVLESCEQGAPDDCWPWQGRWHGRYGQLQYAGERWLAHRAAYHTLVGDIPAGYVVMHQCDRGACVNPRHLVIGTQADNVYDMIRKGRAGWQDADTDWLIEATARDLAASRRHVEPWPGGDECDMSDTKYARLKYRNGRVAVIELEEWHEVLEVPGDHVPARPRRAGGAMPGRARVRPHRRLVVWKRPRVAISGASPHVPRGEPMSLEMRGREAVVIVLLLVSLVAGVTYEAVTGRYWTNL